MAACERRQCQSSRPYKDWRYGVESPLLQSVRIPAHEQLAKERQEWRKDNQPGNRVEFKRIPLLQDARQEKFHAVTSRDDKKIGARQQQYFGMAQGFENRHAMARTAQRFLARQFLFQRLAFLDRKPVGIARPVLQHEEDNDAEHDGWDAPK